MSAKDSHLDSANYEYDLVVGTTQGAINATMKNYLSNLNADPFVACYVYDANVPEGASNYVLTDYNALVQTLGFDPFEIPADTDMSDPRFAALQAQKFCFGFKATNGIPNYKPNTLPDIVVLDQGITSVSYNLYAKDFQIINYDPGDAYSNASSWDNYSQSDYPAPWVFKFIVDLDLTESSDAFNQLPQETQDEVKNLCPNDIFSVQQLYLDLNTAQLESTPTITGVEQGTDLYNYLANYFIGTYLNSLHENGNTDAAPANSYVLNYAIQTEDQSYPNDAVLVPSDLTFLVSPYTKDSSNYSLYTLNWVVMTNGNPMPGTSSASRPAFSWDWVEDGEQSDKSGVMSIKKEIFVDYVNSLLSDDLQEVCLVPSCSVNAIKVDFDLSFSPTSNKESYSTVSDPGSDGKVLSFSFSATDSDSDDDLLVMYTSMKVTYSLSSAVYFQGSTIKIVTTATVYLYMDIEGAKYEGDVCKYTTTAKYILGVDDFGQLSVTEDSNNPVCEDNSDEIDTSWWGTLITFGNMDDIIRDIQSQIKSTIKSYSGGYRASLASLLTSSTAFVFPSTDTFSFAGAAFSDYQDVIADVTYIDPVY